MITLKTIAYTNSNNNDNDDEDEEDDNDDTDSYIEKKIIYTSLTRHQRILKNKK